MAGVNFEQLRADCTELTDEQFDAVVDHLIENRNNYIDGKDVEDHFTGAVYMVGHYYIQSAIKGAAKDLGLTEEKQLWDIEQIAEELENLDE